jgi:hypothetical protein
LLAKQSPGQARAWWTELAGTVDYVLLSSLEPRGPYTTEEAAGADAEAGLPFALPAVDRVYYRMAGRTLSDCLGPVN